MPSSNPGQSTYSRRGRSDVVTKNPGVRAARPMRASKNRRGGTKSSSARDRATPREASLIKRCMGSSSTSAFSPPAPQVGGPSGNISALLPYENLASQQQQILVSASVSPDHLSTIDDDHDAWKTVMAIDLDEAGTLGCAYLATDERQLFLLGGATSSELNDVERLIVTVRPTTVLSSARACDRLTQYLEGETRKAFNNESLLPSFCHRILVPCSFDYETARDRLLKLLPGTRGANETSRDTIQVADSMRLSAFIDPRELLSVGCAGAVLADFYRMLSSGFVPLLGAGPDSFRIRSISMFSLSDTMYINADSLRSLQIIRSEIHPNYQGNGSGATTGSKESLSLLGLLQPHAHTPQGKARLQNIILRPCKSLDLIKARHQSVSVFCLPQNGDVLASAQSTLKSICNIRSVLAKLRMGVETMSGKGPISKGTWANLMQFSFRIVGLREHISRLVGADDVPVFIIAVQSPSITRVGQRVEETIDLDKSSMGLRVMVVAGVDPALDELKRQYDGMESLLADVGSEMAQRMPDWSRRYLRRCVYLPQLGFFSVVSRNPNTGMVDYDGQGLTGERWEQRFTEEGQAFCKNSFMRELDSHYGDIFSRIQGSYGDAAALGNFVVHLGLIRMRADREIEIVHGLAKEVIEFEDLLEGASDACGNLDAIMALASVAIRYQWIQPTMTDANVIRIRNGQHPLQALTVQAFVPNDCDIAGGDGAFGLVNDASPSTESARGTACIMALTGPNHSGKSVYLKQTALIVYLAHVGSFVPAEEATIGVVDKILTRISTRESVTGEESAFGHDLRQTSFLIRASTSRSLVVVDEFGKGTRSDDGAGLMTALLHHFSCLGPDMPRALIATHFHEIFECGLLDHTDSDPGITYGHMEVRVDGNALDGDLAYLYTLKRGRSMSSFGIMCAEMNGVAANIIGRAKSIALMLAQNKRLGAACAHMSREEEASLEVAEDVARRFVAAGGDAVQGLVGGFNARKLLADILHARILPGGRGWQSGYRE